MKQRFRNWLWRLPWDRDLPVGRIVRNACISIAHHPVNILYVVQWLRSIGGDHNEIVSDEMPWVTYSAMVWLRKVVQPGMSVFEFGSGGSTLFFARIGANVISVEHDEAWATKLRALVGAKYPGRAELIHVPPKPVDSATCDPVYLSASPSHVNESFKEYVNVIDNYPDHTFDLIFVDGRARVASMSHAISKVVQGGWLVLDNSDVPAYQAAGEQLCNCPREVFWGFVPYSLQLTQMSAWQVRSQK